MLFRSAPDHPYVQQHPQWFRWRADGSVQYAENPPKKYEDIYPFNFECDDWQALWQELMQKGCAAEAETYFERALKVACQQDAKSPQLRAATSLFEQWQAHGRAERAPALLRESCDWFSEGHDTAFVQRARTLLDSRPLTPAPIS